MSQAGLYVVATPIGNLEDISHRAVRLLSGADLIAAEDTRSSRVLLSHYGITTPMLALHEHNEARVVGQILERITNAEAVALISDAGTPLISDPGYRLVRSAREAGLPVFSLPGPSAVTAALSVAGLPPDRFAFEGFLPSKAVARKKMLKMLSCEPRTLVFFESSHRIEAAIDAMAEVFGRERLAAVCRELTKKFETVMRAPLAEISKTLAADKNQTKGEFVIVVDGFAGREDEAMSTALTMASALLEYLPASQAARVAAKLNDVSRREVYRLLEQ
ncbi:MAG: 16S rRNA (cytidine(1402)-2'-O)-methyltransferase [Gammaproteobacteria bacterium]|nr:MAG: 16S rRNA (cytidine(1402)-2'-O)-methyltransferase [Gammaproteobacteria bacterium]